MPSYIELDKQASFPPSSNVGKMIFGIKTNEKAALTDHLGQTIEIGGGGGGTGCNVTPCPNDYQIVSSYGSWIFGRAQWGPGNDQNKFDVIADEYDQTDYLTLTLEGGQINGCNISSCSAQTITVDYTNLIYRDDGYGLYPANYIDFINSIFSGNSLYTTISGVTASPDYKLKSNYCKVDDFILIFKDYGQLNGSPLGEKYFVLTSRYGFFLADCFGNDLNNLWYSLSSLSIIWSP